jgi:Pyruvate/2-oxoacid:ferredoxin oxidoreductase delta subunit
MPKALFCYFSGTGNSADAAYSIASRLKTFGYSPFFLPISHNTPSPSGLFDLIVFVFPVYACALPHIVQRFFKKLPDGRHSKTAVISTNGEVDIKRTIPGYEGVCLLQAESLLKRKHYDVFFMDTVGYPHNITNFVNTPTEEERGGIINLAQEKLTSISNKIARFEEHRKRYPLWARIGSTIFGILYSALGRRMIGKLYIADHNCNACGKCARYCPAEAIRIKGRKPRWDFNCEGCERCINICPAHAIQTSLARGLILIGTAVGALIPFLFIPAQIPQWFLSKGIHPIFFISICVILYFILHLGLFYISDKILFLLERIPLIQRIFEFSHTKKFRRYLAPNFNRNLEEQNYGR